MLSSSSSTPLLDEGLFLSTAQIVKVSGLLISRWPTGLVKGFFEFFLSLTSMLSAQLSLVTPMINWCADNCVRNPDTNEHGQINVFVCKLYCIKTIDIKHGVCIVSYETVYDNLCLFNSVYQFKCVF